MERTLVSLQADQREALQALAGRTGLSMTDLIRLAVRRLVEEPGLFLAGMATHSHSGHD